VAEVGRLPPRLVSAMFSGLDRRGMRWSSSRVNGDYIPSRQKTANNSRYCRYVLIIWERCLNDRVEQANLHVAGNRVKGRTGCAMVVATCAFSDEGDFCTLSDEGDFVVDL
jgi:hypothetical protein